MQYRYLGRSRFKVSVLTEGGVTFGGSGKVDMGGRDASRPPLLYPYWHQSFSAQDRLSPVDLDLIGPYAEEFSRG